MSRPPYIVSLNEIRVAVGEDARFITSMLQTDSLLCVWLTSDLGVHRENISVPKMPNHRFGVTSVRRCSRDVIESIYIFATKSCPDSVMLITG